MPSIDYSYTISTTCSGGIHVDSLAYEIRSSPITKNLHYIYVDSESDIVTIWFRDSLTQDDESVLLDILRQHEGRPIGWSTTLSGVYPEYTKGMIIDEKGNPLGVNDERPFVVETHTVSEPHALYSESHFGILDDSQIPSTIARYDTLSSGYLNGLYYTESEIDYKFTYLSAGSSTPEFTYHGNSYITVSGCKVSFFVNRDEFSIIETLDVGENSFYLFSGPTNYIVANYNNGNPILQLTTDVDVIDESLIIPILTITVNGSDVRVLRWKNLNSGLSNKIHARFVRTDRFKRETGFNISTNNRYLIVSSGIAWYGAVRVVLPSFNSQTESMEMFYRVNGEWSLSNTNLLENKYFDNGVDLEEASPSTYLNCWVFRYISDISTNKCAFILGRNAFNSLREAEIEYMPNNLPAVLERHAIFIGRITFQYGQSSPVSIGWSFARRFPGEATENHNSLDGIQGGSINDYFHLTESQYNNLTGGNPVFSTISGVYYGDGSNLYNISHSQLSNLDVDDHQQYLNISRGDNRYYTKSQVDTISGAISSKIITIHGDLYGLTNDDHPQYHTDSRGDARYYTKAQVDSISGSIVSQIISDHGQLFGLGDDDHPQYLNELRADDLYYRKAYIENSGNIKYNNYANVSVSGAIDRLYTVYKHTGYSGRIYPEYVLTLSGLDVVVNAGAGYITDGVDVNTFITWPTAVISGADTYPQGNWHVYVNEFSEIQISPSTEVNFEIISLGIFVSAGIAGVSPLIINQPCLISSAGNRVVQNLLRLGPFISDDAGSVSVSSYHPLALFAGRVRVNWALSNYILDEVDTVEDLPNAYLLCVFKSSDDSGSFLVDGWFSNPNGGGGKVYPDRWNDASKSAFVVVSGSFNFNYESSIVTASGDYTSLISDNDFVYLQNDGMFFMAPVSVSGVTYDNGVTTVLLEGDYLGPGGSGNLVANKCLPRLNDGQYVKHLVMRTLDTLGGLYIVLGDRTFTSETDAKIGALPYFQEQYKFYSVKLAYLIGNKGLTSWENRIFDLRPIPFYREGGGAGGGTAVTAHNKLSGLLSDDHPQYLTESRGDVRYYTKSQLNNGQLNNLYYTKPEVDAISGTITSQLHDRRHSIKSSDDHFAETNWSLFYSDNNGAIQELPFGVSGTILTSRGQNSPIWGTIELLSEPLPLLQISRTTDYTATTSWSSLTFNFVDSIYGTALSLDDIDLGRVNVYESGYYEISYILKVNPPNDIASDRITVGSRLYKNNNTVISGSQQYVTVYEYETHILSGDCVVYLNAGDYFHLQVQKSAADLVYIRANTSLTVEKLQGSKGDKGDPGSGTTIYVHNNGLPVSGSPFDTLNFKNFTVSGSTTSGVVDISVVSTTTPGNPNYSVQFNDSGVFGGSSGLIYNPISNKLTISGTSQATRLVLGGEDFNNNAALYIQVDGDGVSEGMRVFFKRSTPGWYGWVTYHYDGSTPNIRIIDEDDDPPYIAFQTIWSGSYDSPQFDNRFGSRGTYGGVSTGFKWDINNITVSELDSQWFRPPGGTTTQRPTTPVAGMTRWNSTLRGLEYYDGFTWQPQVFGNYFAEASDESDSSTTSATWQNKVRLTTSSLPAGKYRIGWSYNLRGASTNVSPRARVLLNGTDTIHHYLYEPKDASTNEEDAIGGFYYRTVTADNTVLTIDLEYASETAGTSVTIRRARLEFWRVA